LTLDDWSGTICLPQCTLSPTNCRLRLVLYRTT